jgi:hypothetical protein
MKNYIIILIVAAFLGNTTAKCQRNDSTLNKLLNVNAASFVNKPLDSIVAILPSG